jgi:hypothetical protein
MSCCYCNRYVPLDAGVRYVECVVLLSRYPLFNIFNNLLAHLQMRWTLQPGAVFPLLDAVLAHPFPGPGTLVSLYRLISPTCFLTLCRLLCQVIYFAFICNQKTAAHWNIWCSNVPIAIILPGLMSMSYTLVDSFLTREWLLPSDSVSLQPILNCLSIENLLLLFRYISKLFLVMNLLFNDNMMGMVRH